MSAISFGAWASRAEVVDLPGGRPYLRGDVGAVRVVVVGESKGLAHVLLRGDRPGGSVRVFVSSAAWPAFYAAVEAGGVEGARGVEGAWSRRRRTPCSPTVTAWTPPMARSWRAVSSSTWK